MSAGLFSKLESSKLWLVTGVAGFIGSNILECLLLNGQAVIGVDNFSTGNTDNLKEVESRVGTSWKHFELIQGDITDLNFCRKICADVNYVLHQAALGSVPRSIEFPDLTNAANVSGFLNVAIASAESNVEKLVYASSSSVYGDLEESPKREARMGALLSPYAISKFTNELYSQVMAKTHGLSSIGLRYFNVFGPRQDPNGAYAAVIPKWIDQIMLNEAVSVYGDGSNSRDFCYVDNVVQANILAATGKNLPEQAVFNVACGESTSLLNLHNILLEFAKNKGVEYTKEPLFLDARNGDISHSLADISKAQQVLGYEPEFDINSGLRLTFEWFWHKKERRKGGLNAE